MRNRSRPILLLLATLPLTAQTDGGKPATVEGVVTDSVTGAPIPRVHVTLQGAVDNQVRQYGTTAGADGKFSMAGIPPGSYSVDGKRAGFVKPSGPRDRILLALKAGDAKTGVEVKLTPTGRLPDASPIRTANRLREPAWKRRVPGTAIPRPLTSRGSSA